MSEPTAIGQSRVPRSMELYRRALELIPGGTQLVSRRPTRYANGVSPVYAARAKGARFWDVDGNEYIDWVSGIGAIILGYCDPVVDEAVSASRSAGARCTRSTTSWRSSWPRSWCRTIPCAEMVRYAKCGGEACAIAVRIARGVTGRDTGPVLRLPRLARLVPGGQPSTPRPTSTPTCSPASSRSACPRPWPGPRCRSPTATWPPSAQLLDDHKGKVAAVIMEPLRSELPPPGYLEGRPVASATQHGVLLIFDEVSCGLPPPPRRGAGVRRRHARHGRVRQVDLQRLPDGRGRRQARRDGAVGPDGAEARKRRTLEADSARHIETTSVVCPRSSRVSTGASRRCCERTNGPRSRPRRCRSTSFTNSSVRTSRT